MKKLKLNWFTVILILGFIVLASLALLNIVSPELEDIQKPQDTETQETTVEDWQKEPGVRIEDVTSASTVVLDDGTFRMFYMQDGKIVYSDSEDGLDFGEPNPTGISEKQGDEWRSIADPSVLRLSDGSWIMAYELRKEEEMREGEKRTGTRSIFIAFSTDGETFEADGMSFESSKEDGGDASKPDLVLLDDNRIRMYYVSLDTHIASAISDDNGETWRREKGFRLEDQVYGPDVIVREGEWMMYYTKQDENGWRIARATSEDGLTWKRIGKDVVVPRTTDLAVTDADVILLEDGSYRMYFGELEAEELRSGNPGEKELRSAILEPSSKITTEG